MSRGEAELEAALQRADAQISRAKPAAPTAAQLITLMRQQSARNRQLLAQSANQDSRCWKKLLLNRFEVGNYRLQPHHYDTLLEFSTWFSIPKPPPNKHLAIVAVGRGDDTGDELMNYGLGFSRALEVGRWLEAWLAGFNVLTRLIISSKGEKDPLVPNTPTGRQQNRSVEIEGCILLRSLHQLPQPGVITT
jgi:outer membrane protein OmpA-like peptidoglycan-associated protein